MLVAVRCAFKKVGDTNHDGLFCAVLGGQAHHDLGKDTPLAPSLPAILQGLMRAIFFRNVPLPLANAIDKNNAAQHTTVIHAWLAVGLRK